MSDISSVCTPGTRTIENLKGANINADNIIFASFYCEAVLFQCKTNISC